MQNPRQLKPLINIGKSGVTDGLITEVRRQLKKRKIIKIRILKSAFGDRRIIAEELRDKANAELVSLVGFTFILRKDRKLFKSRSH